MEWIPVAIVAWSALLGAAQMIVRVTPGEKDDRFVSKVAGWTEKARNILSLQRPGARSKDQNR